jgi:hypothetical protein
LFLTYRRRVSTSTASQQHVHPLHWSRRIAADNPHGFADKVLSRLRAIEDPVEREIEEKSLLIARNDTGTGTLKLVAASYRARLRDLQEARKRQQYIDAGYVM